MMCIGLQSCSGKQNAYDAHDWEDSTYRVTSADGPMAQVYHVETEIPTAGHDCWIMFDVAQPADGGDFDVLFFQAIRSGVGGDTDD